MLFRRRRRTSGVSLTSLIVIGGALYGTGAGAWLTARIAELPSACYQGLSGGQAVCAGAEKVSSAVVAFATHTGGFLDGILGRTGAGLSNAPPALQTGMLNGSGLDTSRIRLPNWGQVNLSQLASQVRFTPDIAALTTRGPSTAFTPNIGGTQALKGALERYILANQFSNPSSVDFSPQKSLAWHTQGAQFGAYGLGSQLALGNAYSQGFGGTADSAAATRYLTQALGSIDQLRSSNDNAAQQYLQSFGASPDAMREQISQQIRALQSQH